MGDDKMRDEFEAWAATKGMAMHLARAESGLYVSRVTQNYMDCWMASRAQMVAENERLQAAKSTLDRIGYIDNGGQLWKPPIGKKPDFDLIDQLKGDVEALRECVEDLALSLECEVKARYAGTQKHPAIKPKYDGDMQEVLDARKLLSKESSHD
jgi:hypothetical protein